MQTYFLQLALQCGTCYTVSTHSVSIAFPLPFSSVHRKSKVWGESLQPFSIGAGTVSPRVLLHFHHRCHCMSVQIRHHPYCTGSGN